ncbi:MAG: hypothetical protein HZB84_04995 [Deltaproteobacteria bacterium]|nr:hypothetical protein [Deltaproteobacteria bacterium]
MSELIIFLPLTFLYLILKSTLFSSLPGIAEFIKGLIMYAVLRLTGLNVHFSGWVFLDSVITAVFAPAIITLFMRLKSLTGRGPFKDNAN